MGSKYLQSTACLMWIRCRRRYVSKVTL